MTEMAGVKFLGKNGWRHSWNDWGLYWTDIFIAEPETETYTINVPGRHGKLDLSEVLTGEPVYKNRLVSADFVFPSKGEVWHERYSGILNELHGRVVRLIFDSDPEYYYEGRCSVSSAREDGFYSSFSVSVDASPFKYELTDSLTDWLWDPLHFENGIIREYGSLIIPANAELRVRVLGSEMAVQPRISVSADCEVVIDGIVRPLLQGTNTDVFTLKNGEKILLFRNHSGVNIMLRIEFRAGRL